ncbi:zinc-ribbon domain-containing protein [Clostridium estertheticum]|uniref:zinc-ribbon domain-containing protein n=1 Tax=Clostridium estertheticum TaxID=238834 RepID=UPI001C0E00E5|nr:zinc-ribbon domain-containing protein [Clostridium estertheticum]MBU3217481.1 hypothetical protein [Clostridium estertheticum]WAG56660.1 zinc-ribbon domain-containing protein [Clostridium estertheticum]
MSIIMCNECNKEISENAIICPHCGNPKHSNIYNIKGEFYDLTEVIKLSNEPLVDMKIFRSITKCNPWECHLFVDSIRSFGNFLEEK